MDIKTLQRKLVITFQQEFAQSDKDNINEAIDFFAETYTQDVSEAEDFLAQIDGLTLANLVIQLANRYNNNNMIIDWIEDKIQLSNEIVGFLVRDAYGVN